MRAALLTALVACAPAAPAAPAMPAPARPPVDAGVALAPDAPPPSQDELLAAIQKAMTDLDGVARQCWAAVAVERFDIEGNLEARVAVGDGSAAIEIVTDTTRTPKLVACMTRVLASYPWAPPLRGQTIQLPFKFRAPDGQSVIDRKLVPWHGQGALAIAVLLDEHNTGNAAASMLEVALEPGASTGLRTAPRAELWWLVSGDGHVRGVGGGPDVAFPVFVPAGGAREVVAGPAGLHAVVVLTPGGPEGTARAGALATPELVSGGKPAGPVALAAARGLPLAAAELQLPAGGALAAHAHARSTELLYVTEGAGTLTVGGNAFPITASSVVQIPPGVPHALAASRPLRALQIFTPAPAP